MTDDEIRAKFCLWAQEQVWLSDDEGKINLRFLGLHKQFIDMTVEHCYRAFAAGVKIAGKHDHLCAPLTDEQILSAIRTIGLPKPMGLTRDVGPYEVTEPTYYLQLLVRAIERAHGIRQEDAA